MSEAQAPSSKPLPRGLVKKGSFNEQVIAVGRRGAGKSEWNIARCLDYARIPCYIVAHDLGHKIPEQLHDGRRTFVRYFGSADEAREGFRKDPRGIFSISSPSADEVMDLANELADLSLEKHGGVEGHPCIFFVDEVVSAEICDPHYIDPHFKQFMMESRHRNVGIVVGTQSSRILHNLLFTQATHVELFSVTDSKDAKRLVECGIPEDVVRQAAKLPAHKSISVKIGM